MGGDVRSNVKNLTLSSLPKVAQFSIFTCSILPSFAKICALVKVSRGGGKRGIGVAFRIDHTRTLSSSGGGSGGDDLHIALFWRAGENSSLLCGGGEAGL